MTAPKLERVLFTYWGRRGAMTQFTLEVARAAMTNQNLIPHVSVSRFNESFAEFENLDLRLLPIKIFRKGTGAVTQSWRIAKLRQQLGDYIEHNRIQKVIELMPHVWSPFVMPAARQAGAHYTTIIHDALPHPGDRGGWAKPVTDLAMRHADRILTLSQSVHGQLLENARIDPNKLTTLFHPDLTYFAPENTLAFNPEMPLRLMFLGRIMPYKGLELFVESVELLRTRGWNVECGVFGEGPLGEQAARLNKLNATLVNRWLTEAEIGRALSQFHAVVLSHTSASQSGVAAAAFGAGLPVVATPVGGLCEQIEDGVTGAVASRIDAPAIAEAVAKMFGRPETYESFKNNIQAKRAERSMSQFVRACL